MKGSGSGVAFISLVADRELEGEGLVPVDKHLRERARQKR